MRFTVFGIPVPQGSMRAFVPRGWKRPIITAANAKTKPWRQQIAGECLAAMGGASSGMNLPMRVEVRFYFPRPKSLKKGVTAKVTKPDLDKLIRAVLDSLTGIVFDDDSQVIEIVASKQFGLPPRMELEITEADLPPSSPVPHQAIKDKDLPF